MASWAVETIQQILLLQPPRLLPALQILAHTAMHLLRGVILLPEMGGPVAAGLPLLEEPVMEDQMAAGLPLLEEPVMEDQMAAGLPLLEEPVMEDQVAVGLPLLEIQAMCGQAPENQEAEAQVAEARADTLPSSSLRTQVASKNIGSTSA